MDNIVFISGVQGSGKTTLIEKLNEKISYVELYRKCEMTSFGEVFLRQIRRVAKYRIDYEMIQEMARANPQRLILCDRSIYDAKVYLDSFYQLRWLTKEQYMSATNMLYALFHSDDMFPKYNYLLLPPLEKVQKWLKKRQRSQIKWREDDETYLRTVYDNYCNLNKDNIRVIEDTDIRSRLSIMKKELDEIYLKECSFANSLVRNPELGSQE